MEPLQNKVIVVTGAGSGIGRAIASHAARQSMRVVLADIAQEPLDRAVTDIQALGADALGVRTDVSDASSVERLAEQAFARFGAVHVLVNNAGVASAETAWETSLAEWDRVLGINLYGVIHGVRSFVPRMLAAREPGHIVNVASAAGLFTVTGFAAYSASKFGVVAFSEALYHDLRARNALLGVSVLCPSWVRTAIASHEPVDAGGDAVTQAVRTAVAEAVQHGVAPEQIAQALFEAILANKFYVLTHPDTKAAVRTRADDIIEDRPPSSLFGRRRD